MKQVQWLGIAAFAAVLASCNGNGTNNGTADTTTTATTTTTTGTVNSDGNYAAMADSFRVNSEAGNILDARTGKAMRVRYDVTTHRAVNEETNQPVWRYVDRRNWWVYGSDNDNWTRVGDARMEGSTLKYKSSSDDSWLNYDERWAQDDQRYMSMDTGSTTTGTTSGTDMSSDMSTDANGEVKVKDNGNKVKDKDVKVKTSKDGDIKIKDKETGDKAKYDAQSGKVKSGH
ncbi:MAG: hypothetical protein EOP50_07545 [Sphingobacteriales bacterium]|nr:MAG: hypothetical protein EOP50_07545 [Sphingobacteriales bacterium]